MDYVKKRFEDLPSRATPVMAADLNNMGDGIEYSVQGVERLTDSVALKANAADVYSRAEVDAAVSPKADKSAVYTKAETYSRTETGTQITNAITASRPPLYGTGFPNGKVAAPVGTLYADEAVTNGASLWQKISGTGNTGWQIVRGDTSLRNVAELLGPSFTIVGQAGASCSISRDGNTVSVRFFGKSLGSTTYAPFLPAIPGFRPPGFGAVGAGASSDGGLVQVGTYSSAGNLDILRPIAADSSFSLGLTYRTFDAWPSTLPGTN